MIDVNAGLKMLGSGSSSDGGPTGFTSDIMKNVGPTVDNLSNSIGSAFTSGVDTAKSFLPGEGDFSVASMSTKAGELFDSAVASGGAVVDKVKGFFTGDNTGAADKLKNSLLPNTSVNDDVANIISQAAGSDVNSESFFVKLQSAIFPDDVVIFNVTPTITETRAATYEEVGIVHHPGQILRYKSSTPRGWTVQVKLVTRTPQEATANLIALNLIRSWVMPYYGEGTNNAFADKLGAPPDILYFSAYGPKMIPPHPVVMESYNTSFPPDIDYLPTDGSLGEIVPFPVLLTIDITLKEAYSPKEFSSFDIKAYKTGNLESAFRGSSGATSKDDSFMPDLSALESGEALETSEPTDATSDSEVSENLDSNVPDDLAARLGDETSFI